MKYTLFFLTILSCILLSGCTQEDQTPVMTNSTAVTEAASYHTVEQRLKITVTAEEGLGFTTIKKEELGGNLTEDLSYLDLKDVCITVDGTVYPLENALRDGQITVEEIFAYARLDARNGFCGEKYETEHGLTHFTYCYPEFYLHLVYDVFISPDGSTHLISDIGLYQPGSNISYFYVDEETGIPLTREDWGLTFEVVEATPTGIVLNCTHSTGQQIGELQAEYYWLSTENHESSIPRLPNVNSTRQNEPLFTIEQNTQGQYSIDWSQYYGELPQGSYIMTLHINDIFNEDQIHPLMEDFSDRQSYDIHFTIS